jgi:hypothetical protein
MWDRFSFLEFVLPSAITLLARQKIRGLDSPGEIKKPPAKERL